VELLYPGMKSKIRLVIFDLDGPLVDAYRPVWRSVNLALKRNGYRSIELERIL
jgi:phosphoglycolate phosphatase-like HAD superfamily hydrolase